MSTTSPSPSLPFLPPTLPLLPLAAPAVLFPFLSVNVSLSADELRLVLGAVAANVDAAGQGRRVGVGKGGRAGGRGATEGLGSGEGKGGDGRGGGDGHGDGDIGIGADSVLHLGTGIGAGAGVGERMLAVVPVVEIERRVGRWATAARIKRITRTTTSSAHTIAASPSGRTGPGASTSASNTHYTLTLEGLARIRLPSHLPPVLSLLPPIPLPISSYALPLPLLHAPAPPDLMSLARPLLPLPPLQLAQADPEDKAAVVAREVEMRLRALPTGLLADMLSTMLGLPFEVRVELLGLVDPQQRSERLERAVRDLLFDKGLPVPVPDTTSPSNHDARSKALVVRRAIGPGSGPIITPSSSRARAPRNAQQSGSGSGTGSSVPEDLHPLVALLEQRMPDLVSVPTALDAVKREMARLVKIPAQSAEYGVVKSYVELLLALPWGRVSRGEAGDVDLDKARKELEEGHEGLEEVKRRVVEYLAVYKLKRQLYDESMSGLRRDAEKEVKDKGRGDMDEATASELLQLIPASDRAALGDGDAVPAAPTIPAFKDKGPILLLVGPPGVGKTSIARSLATAMSRPFHRISLGGVRDEAEIRGHRRTYVGALPGLLISALRKTGASNPLILLDELDKVSSSSHRGDPAAALLEALDPEQNGAFHDHYLGGEVDVDLGRVVFVATANETEGIPPALLDRCEVIECRGYDLEEKVRIAQRFLVAKVMGECGMREGWVRVEEEGVRAVVEGYTMESGVRNVERQIGKLVRAKALEYASALDKVKVKVEVKTKAKSHNQGETEIDTDRTTLAATTDPSTSSSTPSSSPTSDLPPGYSPDITLADITRILGHAPYTREPPARDAPPGVVHGLGYRGSGMGSVLLLEAARVPHGRGPGSAPDSGSSAENDNAMALGKLRCTGRLGEVIQESAELALSWVRSRAGVLGLKGVMRGYDVHLHLPSGAIKKDGPSAGIGMVVAFVSLFSGRSVPGNTAFTGEVTLRGAVMPVGGIREKVLAAHRAGMTRIIMSHRNEKDVEADVSDVVKRDVTFRFVRTVEEALEEVWGVGIWAAGAGAGRVEARL